MQVTQQIKVCDEKRRGMDLVDISTLRIQSTVLAIPLLSKIRKKG